MIVKIMKGDESFRKKSKALLQSSNEVFVYTKIIPYFIEIFADGQWVAKAFFADIRKYPELSDQMETILALQDLNSIGYRMTSSRIDLDAEHLKVMTRKIAVYHSISLAMKISKDPKLDELVAGLIPFHIKSDTQGDLEPYKYLCPISFERIFAYVSRTPEYCSDVNLNESLNNLKKNMPKLMDFLESFLRSDHQFVAILHGDYYRNNVMFKYDENEVPVDLRMFDFQEVRYASVAIDLSIFMYMHVHSSLKPLIWDHLLELYHETLINSLTNILKYKRNDEKLSAYNFESFIEHFEKFAFYGVAVSVQSIPWMASPEEETQKISEFFERDMHDPEFKALLKVCGGVDVSERILSNVKHASEKGYMKIFD